MAPLRIQSEDKERWQDAEIQYKKASYALKLVEQIQGETFPDTFYYFYQAARKLLEAALIAHNAGSRNELIQEAKKLFLQAEHVSLLRAAANLIEEIEALSERSSRQREFLELYISNYSDISMQMKQAAQRYSQLQSITLTDVTCGTCQELLGVIRVLQDYKKSYLKVAHHIDRELAKVSN